MAKANTGVVAPNTDRGRRSPPPLPSAGMTKTPFDELVHRVNNLLGTIEIQAEVAKALGDVAAYADAMQKIVDSARRTQDDVRRLREAVKERP